MLYDAKIPMNDYDRESLLSYYIGNFCDIAKEDHHKFRGYYSGFSMIRVMQALGAFGFRGLYEQKPTFTDSIVPGVRLLNQIISQAENHISLPELFTTVRSIPDTPIFVKLSQGSNL
jgi:hypothetical protein